MERRFLLVGMALLSAACGGVEEGQDDPSNMKALEQRLVLFDYMAEDTNSAQNVATSALSGVYLSAGETVMLGTCGLTESASSGDTYIRLFSPSMAQVAESDDACGLASKISYTAASAGVYQIQAGCLGNSTCSGTVALARRKALFTVTGLSNTNNAKINTFNRQYSFNGGDVVRVSTCATTAYGAAATGDTFLRIFQQNNGTFTTEVAAEDGGCGGGTASEIIYNVPITGSYQIRVGCAANTTCSATVAVYVE